jgi:hypothetical protein
MLWMDETMSEEKKIDDLIRELCEDSSVTIVTVEAQTTGYISGTRVEDFGFGMDSAYDPQINDGHIRELCNDSSITITTVAAQTSKSG